MGFVPMVSLVDCDTGAMTLVWEKGMMVLTGVQRLWGFVIPSVDGGNEARGSVVLPEAWRLLQKPRQGMIMAWVVVAVEKVRNVFLR